MAPPGDEDEQSSSGFPSFQYTKKALVDRGNSEGKNERSRKRVESEWGYQKPSRWCTATAELR